MASSAHHITSPGLWHRKLPFALAIFTGAFLVFQVQPVLARFILPWFGGSAGVWTVCMLFFQAGLLAGYAYAHVLATSFRIKRQVLVHGALLLGSLFILPLDPHTPDATSTLPETLQIILVLSKSVGIPFVLLSASAPLMQHWFADVNPGESPYRLYALSNAGSLLALLSYPLWIERVLTVSDQSLLWSIGYFLYLSSVVWCFLLLVRGQGKPRFIATETSPESRVRTRTGQQFAWLVYSAMGSILLLAITNQLSQDVSVVPFLWVLPLSVYLVTFIICFEHPGWYRRSLWMPAFIVSAATMVCVLNGWLGMGGINLVLQVALYNIVLFTSCMVCHGELVRRRGEVSQLTEFYMHVALGGVLGGLFVGIVATYLFDGYWELPLVIFLTLVVTAGAAWNHFRSQETIRLWGARAVMVIGVFAMAWSFLIYIQDQRSEAIYTSRNFYGVVRVIEEDEGHTTHLRKLRHGNIEHGRQLMDRSLRTSALSYYGARTPVDLVMNHATPRTDPLHPTSALRLGVIGLGIGTIATYARDLDTIRFYEINEDVYDLAKNYFSYLSDSRGMVEVVLGDGRRMLEHELKEAGSQKFDVLIVDAFSGDAIPMHLMTTEASELYWRHLNDDGVLIFHISNLHVDLSDVVRNLAAHAGKKAAFVDEEGRGAQVSGSSWVMITSDDRFLNDPHVKPYIDSWDHTLKPIVWSDEFSNLFDVIEW